MNNIFSHNDFIYKVEINKNDIRFLLEYPETYKLQSSVLYKYYGLIEHNIDSILNSYLYACHPKELNDFYDSSGVFIDYSNQNENIIRKFIYQYNPDFLKRKGLNREILERHYDNLIQTIRFGKLGIISFSKNFDNILMWAYYGNQRGFCVGYNYLLFPQKNLYGPFPINYNKELTKIDISKYPEALCFHFQTNSKYFGWSHEQEYRYIAYNEEGLYDPEYLRQDKEKRKHKIDLNAINEIIFGNNFFHKNELIGNKLKLRLKQREGKLRLKLLNYIIDNKMSCSLIVYNKDKYKLAKRGLKIIPIKSNEFRIEIDEI
jgi:hypothetical protein